jgi:peptide/nickel transport system substrate-binding protein
VRRPKPDSETLRLVLAADITGIYPNPPINNEAFTFHVNRNLFEGLAGFDERFPLEPVLAESWVTPDARTYLFTLRPGLRFSDGSPVTAADVAASLQAAQRHHWVTRDYLQAIESVRAVDAGRVEIRTRSPYLILLHRLVFGFVLPASAVDRTPVPTIGTGRYRLASWQPGRELVLVSNPYHSGSPPHFARARFLVVEDAATRVRMVQEGAADVADHVPHDELTRLAADHRGVRALPPRRMGLAGQPLVRAAHLPPCESLTHGLAALPPRAGRL